ncbi:P22 phage major capsid protein family protein [Sulfitobacter sp. 20_GPM-1509m]|uniref:P22 phage major capsid protein family protein n=1 Tax=Sulfitobacter sp. 20_GPM-1509m TaxID=1380367 RepID=UPI00048F418F|nr:P22 phage major capsid protein family protein [Sulfitobacter sp. 20_GPM-1509m]
MANTFLTPSVFAQEGLMQLENELVLGNKVHTDHSKEFTMKGDTISIRRPAQYLGQDDDLDVTSYREDITQGKTTISMDKTVSIKVDIGALDGTLSFDRVQEDVIKPVVIKMRDRIETELAALYTDLYYFTGTPGTVPSTFLSLGEGGAIMTDGGVPQSSRFAVHGTNAALQLADGLKGVYVQDKAKTAFEEAMIGRYAAFDNYESVHAPTHTVGVATGTPLVNGGTQAVTYAAAKDSWSQSLVTDGWTNSTTGILKKGDVITLAGVFAVNPVSKESTGRLQTFTVLADADSGASTGPATLTISPPIITSGAYQTVTAQPANDAAIVVKTGTGGTGYKQSLLLHPKAFALVTRPLKIPTGAGVKTSTKAGNKVTISCTEWVDGNTLQHNMRFDMLFGVKCLDPRLGARLTN